MTMLCRKRVSHPLMAIASVLILTGACSNSSQGLPGQRAAADPSKPDRYWTAHLKKKFAEAAPARVGRTFYAAPAGDDQSSGTRERPWRTLQRAAVTMEPGDTLLIEDGEYPGGIQQRKPGEPGRPITYRAVNIGKAFIRGEETGPFYAQRQFRQDRRPAANAAAARKAAPPPRDAILVTHADHIVVEGLVVRNAPRAGIRVDQSNNVAVRYCRFLNNGVWGIFTDYSDDLLIEYNECAFSGKQHGIYVSNSGDRPIVRYNSSHDNARCGIQLNGDAKQRKPSLGKRGDGIIEDAVITGNVIYGNGIQRAGAALNLACVHNATITNNLLYNNQAGGIALFNDHRRDMLDFGSKKNRILHNTVYFRPGEGRACLTFKHGSTDNIVRNNIFSAGKAGVYEFDETCSFTADYNLFWNAEEPVVAANSDSRDRMNAAEWKKQGKNDVHSLWGEPRFISIQNGDFRPQGASPAAGRAFEEASILSDVEGRPRPRGAKRSIGALEAADR